MKINERLFRSKIEDLGEFFAFVQNIKATGTVSEKQEISKIYYKIPNSEYGLPASTIIHDSVKHNMKLKDWKDLCNNLDSYEDCVLSNKQQGFRGKNYLYKYYFEDEYFGVGICNTKEGKLITTFFRDSEKAIDKWLKQNETQLEAPSTTKGHGSLLNDGLNYNITQKQQSVKVLNERLEELQEGIYATNSVHEVVAFLKNKKKAVRLIYDKNINYYFIGDALSYIHGQIFKIAVDNAFYYDVIKDIEYSKLMDYLGNGIDDETILMASYFPKGFGDETLIDEDRSTDFYINKYIYDFGNLYVHIGTQLEDFELFSALGKLEDFERLEIEMCESINERLEELEDDIFATQSAYDVLNLMKNKAKPYRVVYDKNIRMYFIGDAYNIIHQDMLEAAYRSGFYPEFYSEGEVRDYIDDCMFNGGELLFFAFSPDSGKQLDVEKSSDGYTRKYVYDFGAIYAHEMTPLEDFDIYNLLKEPIKKETILEDICKLNKDMLKLLED